LDENSSKKSNASSYTLYTKNQDKLFYNGKYNQILWGIEKKGLKPEDFYLSLKETNDPQSGKAAPYGSGYAKLKDIIKEIIQEDESLRKWFKRSGTPGKEGGWVDCNSPIRKDGKITGYKSCGRKKAKNEQNILHVVLQQQNVKTKVKVKLGEKQNEKIRIKTNY
jgi:hypothetical protein